MVYENYLQVVNRNYLLSLVEYGGIVEIEKTEKQKWNKNKKYKTKSFLNSTSAPKLPKLKINVNIFKKGKKSKNYLNNKKIENLRRTETAIVKMLSAEEFYSTYAAYL